MIHIFEFWRGMGGLDNTEPEAGYPAKMVLFTGAKDVNVLGRKVKIPWSLTTEGRRVKVLGRNVDLPGPLTDSFIQLCDGTETTVNVSLPRAIVGLLTGR